MNKNKRKPKAKSNRPNETAELRQRLAEARQHRDLLINTVHRLAGLAAAAPLAEAAADTETCDKVKKIVRSYGMVPNPTCSTIVGPAVPSMSQFTMDVNLEFGRSYVNGQLKSTWTIHQTAYYIDNNP